MREKDQTNAPIVGVAIVGKRRIRRLTERKEKRKGVAIVNRSKDRKKKDQYTVLYGISRSKLFDEREVEERKEFRTRLSVGVAIVRKFERKAKKRTFTGKKEIHTKMNTYTENIIMSPFDPQVEHILSLISFRNNDIWKTLAANHILNYKSFKQLNKKQLLNMTRNVNGTPTKLFGRRVKHVVDGIEYMKFHEANRDYDLAADPTSWNREDFKDWRCLGNPKSIAAFTPKQKRLDEIWRKSARRNLLNSVVPAIISNEEVTSNLNGVAAAADDYEIDTAKFQRSKVPVSIPVPITTSSTTTTAPEIVSTEEVVSKKINKEIVPNKEVVLNLNVVDADDDEIDNAKLQRSTVPITTSSTTTATVIRMEMLDIHAKIALNEIRTKFVSNIPD